MDKPKKFNMFISIKRNGKEVSYPAKCAVILGLFVTIKLIWSITSGVINFFLF